MAAEGLCMMITIAVDAFIARSAKVVNRFKFARLTSFSDI